MRTIQAQWAVSFDTASTAPQPGVSRSDAQAVHTDPPGGMPGPSVICQVDWAWGLEWHSAVVLSKHILRQIITLAIITAIELGRDWP